MKLILRNSNNDFIKSISFAKFEAYQNFISELSSIKEPVEAHLFTANERITSNELAKLKFHLKQLNIKFSDIYSNNRETVLSGKSLKINSSLLNNKKNINKSFLDNQSQKKDILHKGTIRSGDRISSNGDLFIMGDVNPGAIVSANNNVYVWGKLLGTAFAGENGNKNASIASLWLNPIQLRICEIIAIGPKEKPKHQYPEIAILEAKKIIIKPYEPIRDCNK
ncbi:possible septum site-determining protein [Prochlorococcus marinus str. MIT 9515]|uniref:Probable septum site-determining protein MinC n=1 Tax=Prochlorococcus marinus (strain MIT 9515) TaxID=167542 RepID=A2BUV2_PROM5|nr:septum site-determining protein MinC [Prochlorococcus marinus]ABM71563.1 possible septum site-determining protein [Prochlorococcus marinus str. MIT 9515]